LREKGDEDPTKQGVAEGGGVDRKGGGGEGGGGRWCLCRRDSGGGRVTERKSGRADQRSSWGRHTHETREQGVGGQGRKKEGAGGKLGGRRTKKGCANKGGEFKRKWVEARERGREGGMREGE